MPSLTKRTLLQRSAIVAAALWLGGQLMSAQTSPNIPVISGGAGMLSSTNKGSTFVQPVVAPVLALPLGNHVLVEARADLRGLVQMSGPNGTWDTSYTSSLEYLQADVLVNRHVTAVLGRFQTPFGVYNERLTALWIRDLQDAPLIFGLGTRTSGSSDGVMLRGNAYGSSKVQVNYTTYFSAERSTGQFQAGRSAGERVEVYLPHADLEIGSSYQHFLQGERKDTWGTHVWWTPAASGLRIRSEYAHGAHAQGYWVETSYRLSRFGGMNSIAGRLQPVFRMQQSFRNSPGAGDGAPGNDTQEADFGLNYTLPQEFRLNTSYARSFSKKNGNIWDISLTYRFLIPTWRGGK